MSAAQTNTGRTAGKLMAAAAYSSIVGVPLVTSEGRRVANTALPDMPKEWDHLKKQAVIDAEFIAHAWNCHDDLTAALRTALDHIEHMAAWISATNTKAKWSNEIYSFESLGEDRPAMRAALAATKTGGAIHVDTKTALENGDSR